VDEDLAGQPLVRRRGVFDANAGELRAQQRFNRQAAAAIGQSDDDAIDVPARNQPIDVGGGADDVVTANVYFGRVGRPAAPRVLGSDWRPAAGLVLAEPAGPVRE